MAILDVDQADRRPGLAARERAWPRGWRRSAGHALGAGRSSRHRRRGIRSSRPSSAEPGSVPRRRAEASARGRPPGRRGCLRITGTADVEAELRAFEPSTLLVSSVEDRTVCLLALDPGRVPALGMRIRELATDGVVDRVEAEPHLAHLGGDRRDPPHPTLGDPVLREPARPVTEFGPSLRALFDDMVETMVAAPGVGLAGPQVGISGRLFVFDDGVTGPMFMANPELSDGVGELLEDEGCLSIPGPYHATPRFARILCRGLDLDGSPYEMLGEASSRGSSSTRSTTSTGCSTSIASTTKAGGT